MCIILRSPSKWYDKQATNFQPVFTIKPRNFHFWNFQHSIGARERALPIKHLPKRNYLFRCIEQVFRSTAKFQSKSTNERIIAYTQMRDALTHNYNFQYKITISKYPHFLCLLSSKEKAETLTISSLFFIPESNGNEMCLCVWVCVLQMIIIISTANAFLRNTNENREQATWRSCMWNLGPAKEF